MTATECREACAAAIVALTPDSMADRTHVFWERRPGTAPSGRRGFVLSPADGPFRDEDLLESCGWWWLPLRLEVLYDGGDDAMDVAVEDMQDIVDALDDLDASTAGIQRVEIDYRDIESDENTGAARIEIGFRAQYDTNI